MSRSTNNKIYQVICLTVSILSVVYLVAILSVVFSNKVVTFNRTLFDTMHGFGGKTFDRMAVHMSNPGFWIPYWCAALLLLGYHDEIKFSQWVKKFAALLLILGMFFLIVNQSVKLFWPQVCGRSANFLHGSRESFCNLLSLVSGELFGIFVFAVLSMKKECHVGMKIMLVISAVLVSFSLVNQGFYFPLQMLATLIIATLGGVLAHLFNLRSAGLG